MELKLSLLPVELFMILCLLSLQALAGLLSLPPLSSASSFIFPIEVKAESDLELSEITHRFLLLESDRSHSPTSAQTKSKQQEHDSVPESIHYHKTNHAQSPSHHPLPKDSNPRKRNIPSILQIPSDPTMNKVHSTSPSSPVSMHKNYHHNGQKAHHIAPEPSHHHSFSRKGSKGWNPKGSLPFPAIPYNHINVPSPSPSPTNQGCSSVKCTEPLIYTPRGSSCGCVLPIEVSLRFSISLYNFFPLVPELSREIAKGVSLNRTQVRILGADAADHLQEKTTALINLVPLNDKFDADTAFSIYRKFWMREVLVKTSVFGAYEVLYVHYTGLPPSPPSRPEGSAAIDALPYSEGNNGDGPLKPIGVDLTRKRKNSSDKNMVIIVVLSSVTAFVVVVGFIMLSLSKSGCFSSLHGENRQDLMNSDNNKQSGGRFLTLRSKPSSGSISFSSSLVAFAGSAKIFTVHEIERATDQFSASRVLGEGGFGIVYGGVLEDGTNVAVKVLKRDNKQGSREFLAEVEMLSRLHHRNLVKLIGICSEEHLRCMVYELVPNGSVESQLHGADKEIAPLDWPSRMKIAIGAARGLAYLHEDSSPRVIHRDFKSSNVLLEHDYTPKVSDFGLARTAMEDENKHISTHVMGTFGYLAPEYAMTGHLLIKSDVYSYGVVLLELLTGRKPVDLTQPPGQENLVSWARPLLTAKEGVEALVDPAIKAHVPLESFARVATIASMLVQPEVSHRPFMGEVVQALRLVCNEIEDRSLSRDEMFSVDAESKHSRITNELLEDLEREECMFEEGRITVSDVDLKGGSDVAIRGGGSESFRREFNSAPLKAERKRRFWQRLRRFSRGSMSEHEYLTRL